ncbi:MAG: methyltransferase family protein [Bryobacteraceae bacterium]
MEYRGVQCRFAKPYADFVARLRVPCGFLLLAAFAWLSRPDGESMLIGLPIAALGLLLRGWAAGHLAKNEDLATSGPYACVRNPLYVGTLLAALGIVIACRSFPLAIVFAAVFLLVYFPVIELEEQHLRDIFPAYAEYASRVRRFLPRKAAAASRYPFRWKLYLKNEEYKALGGFVLAVAWLVFKCIWMPR